MPLNICNSLVVFLGVKIYTAWVHAFDFIELCAWFSPPMHVIFAMLL